MHTMSASPPATASPRSRKRSFDAVDGPSPSKGSQLVSVPAMFPTLATPPTLHDSAPASTTSSRLSSPAPSSAASVNADAHLSAGVQQSSSTKLALPVPKRRKLTAVEKEVKRTEAEAKEKSKAEEKAKKDEQKRVKDEERRRKKEEEEEKKRKREVDAAEKKAIKDAETQKKEDEKRKKEDEKNKKERSQLRLGSFFKKPDVGTPPSPTKERRLSADADHILDAKDVVPSTFNAASPTKTTNPKAKLSDYEREFPSFFLKSHTQLAPYNRFEKDEEAMEYTKFKMDSYLKETPASLMEPPPAFNAFELLQIVAHKRNFEKGVTTTVKDLITKIHGSSNDTIDLTASIETQNLRSVPMKILHFREDVRPPYQGTYTKRLSARSASKISRNPFHRALPEMNYDYDSEAEWEEPEEGEDLGSEVEDEQSEGGDDEMDDFLDDEEDAIGGKRRQIVGDLQPWSSDMCWERFDTTCHSPKLSDFDVENYRMEFILDATIPIDPLSNAYWSQPSGQTSKLPDLTANSVNAMNPPSRVPLNAINQPNSINKTVQALMSKTENSNKFVPASALPLNGEGMKGQKPRRMISDAMLPAFKQAVQGSNLTKAGLIEVLKKQFPKVSKDTIKDTLNAVAVREGQKEADKIWTLVDAGDSIAGTPAPVAQLPPETIILD